MIMIFLNIVLNDASSLLQASRFVSSKEPNPSSIISMFVFGRVEMLISATLIAKDDIIFSIPDASSTILLLSP